MSNNNTYMLLGDNSAEKDKNLYDCEIPKKKPDENKLILTGKWGTGKSAILILHNKVLENILNEIDPLKRRAWYIDEQTLDVTAIVQLRETFGSDKSVFLRSLEKLWEVEIIRVYSELLSLLYEYFEKPKGKHWAYITGLQKIKPIWNSIQPAIDIFMNKTNINPELSKYFDGITSENIQRCLLDLESKKINNPICVAIEPIETPSSNIETNALAQPLITALLNIFERKFSPSINQRMKVRLSLPWHRYEPIKLNFPQKISQYVGKINWNKKSLKDFIDKRIEYEFKRVGRHIKQNSDIFYMLFEEKIKNEYCQPQIYEKTFDYILRHTHHRARDVQELIRACIEEQANKDDTDIEQILRKGKINQNTVKDVLRIKGRELTTNLISESTRTFPILKNILDSLYSIQVPFSRNDLFKRFQENNIDFDKNKLLETLWKSGLIGIVIHNKNEKIKSFINGNATLDNKEYHYNYVNDNKKDYCWNFFEYNCQSENINSFLERLDKFEEKLDYGLTFHPKTYEYFSAIVTRKFPIGV